MKRKSRLVDLNDERTMALLQRKQWDRSARDVGEEEEEDVLPVTANPLKLYPTYADATGLQSSGLAWDTSDLPRYQIIPQNTIANDIALVGVVLSEPSNITTQMEIRILVIAPGITDVEEVARIPFYGDGPMIYLFPLAVRVPANYYVAGQLVAGVAALRTVKAKLLYYDMPLEAVG